MFDRFRYGVCYYPEHWDAARHASDVRRIAECGFNVVRLGEGAWGYWEPQEGKYQFDLFDRVIDLCARHGIQVIMGTPTYCAPAWVSNSYPEVLRWNFERIPMKHGSRRNFNYTSPKYYELSDRVCTALAEHYKDNPQVIAWQLDNEFNCHMDVSYAPSDTLAFRAWLKERYKTLDALNRAWGTAFWSQQYDAWEQIDLPHPTPTCLNPTQQLDESRFVSDCVVRFARRQADVLRRHNPEWRITHNGLFANVNGPNLMTALDFFCHDNYPLFQTDWTGSVGGLAQSRSLSFPFGVMEEQSGPGGQMSYFQRTPRPGEMRLWAWQTIAHGAKLLSYFRWRTCPYGSEQHWHGLLDPDDRDNRRLAEAKLVGAEIGKLPAAFFDARPAKVAAVLRTFDNDVNDRRINTYVKENAWEAWAWVGAFARKHVPADLLHEKSDVVGYALIVAPHFKIASPAMVQKLRAFVEAGGTLVLTAQSGLKDENCHLVEMPLPGLFRELAGAEIEDWSTVPQKQTHGFRLDTGEVLQANVFVEKLRPTTAEPVARWLGDDALLGDAPAVTRNRVGKGSVYYVGGYCTGETVAALVGRLMDDLEIKPVVRASVDVEAVLRTDGKRKYLALLNHTAGKQRVSGVPKGKELISGADVADGQLALSGHGVAVVELSGPLARYSGRGLG